VYWGCYYATALDIEVDPQRRVWRFFSFFKKNSNCAKKE